MWQGNRNGSATWAFMTMCRIGPSTRTAARHPGSKHAAAVVRNAIKTPCCAVLHGWEVPSGLDHYKQPVTLASEQVAIPAPRRRVRCFPLS